ncbi:MAG: sulfite exporter TauE/SafE family protein [Xanthobacteraceae bacterium]|nr:sulfite exporter TauE/SafE family protein [Xanthobacteraceae bacterium]
MIDLPTSETFAAALAEPRIYAAMAVAALAGVTRGFSGFGGAMVYMPLVSAIYDPRIAAVTVLLVDLVAATPFAIPELRRCTWREVGPLSIAMAAGLPLGVWLLVVLDPIVLRWCIAIVVLSLVPMLASGWRYHGPPRLPLTLGVGLFSGVSGGAVLIAGPPVILYWLGGGNSPKVLRANLMVLFMICDVLLVAIFGHQGMFEPRPLALSLLLGVPYLVGMGIGAYFFQGASDKLYRTIAYAIITLAAIVSLPVLDSILR